MDEKMWTKLLKENALFTEGFRPTGVWTLEQDKQVEELDKEYHAFLKKKNIDKYSYEASQVWKSKFRQRFRKIFGK